MTRAGAYPVTLSDTEWRAKLTPEQFDVMRAHGTEAPGSCALLHEKRPGLFSCAGCGAVDASVDRSYGMVRTEVHCATCGSHLGHVFDDGPPPTNLRYCINGVAMTFMPA